MNVKTLKLKILLAAFLIFMLAAMLLSTISVNGVAAAATDFKSAGKSAYLIDYGTGSVIYSRNENDRLPIASMVKIMTATLAFEAIERGEVSLDDDVVISENSSSMGGSQVFLQTGDTHKLGELLKTVIVASANDSCVAIAEHIEGSVEGFVAKMNRRAKELGMQNTAFKNCTGLPAAESFSSAKDVSIMFRRLLDFPKYYEYAGIWLEDYAHPDGRVTTITNTNKLVKFYSGCDGGKTGYTSEAKFCLSATAKRADMRIIAVIIGVDSAKERNAAVSSMFDYAFANYRNEILLKRGEIFEKDIQVVGGKKSSLQLTVKNDISQFMSKDDSEGYELKYDLQSSVKAPVKAGDEIGKVYLTKDGVVICEAPVVSAEDIERMSFFGAILEIAKRWNTR